MNMIDEKNGRTTLQSGDYDLVYKVLVIGESSVGKTALVHRYMNPNKTIPNLLPTIGIDYRVVDFVIDGLRVRVQLWDTVGQERYRTMTKNYFRGAKGVLLLFDVTNRKSFVLVKSWVSCLEHFDLDKEEVFIIGNKIDLKCLREVSYAEAKKLSYRCGMKYFETSARTGENVEETVEQLIYNMKDANNPFQEGPYQTMKILPNHGNKWEDIPLDKDEKIIKLGKSGVKKKSCCQNTRKKMN